MTDFSIVIELLQAKIRSLDYLNKPNKNTVTADFAKDNIARAVVIHAAIDILKNANHLVKEERIYAWRNPSNEVVISNDKKQDLLWVGQSYPNFSEPLYTEEF